MTFNAVNRLSDWNDSISAIEFSNIFVSCYSDSPGNRNSIFLAALNHVNRNFVLKKFIERNIARQNKCFATSNAQCMMVSDKGKSISSLNLSKNIIKLCLRTVSAGPLRSCKFCSWFDCIRLFAYWPCLALSSLTIYLHKDYCDVNIIFYTLS